MPCTEISGILFSINQPVRSVIHDFIWNSFLLAFVSFILEMAIAIPVGVFSATKVHSAFDVIFTIVAFAGISLPSFFLALLLQKAFSVDLGCLPLDGMSVGRCRDDLCGPAYPGCHPAYGVARHLPDDDGRSAERCVMYVLPCWKWFIRTISARPGQKDFRNVWLFINMRFKNASIPIVTFIGGALPGLFSGAMITETVFGWPGIGKVFLDSISKRDYMFMMGYIMLLALLIMLGNLAFRYSVQCSGSENSLK